MKIAKSQQQSGLSEIGAGWRSMQILQKTEYERNIRTSRMLVFRPDKG